LTAITISLDELLGGLPKSARSGSRGTGIDTMAIDDVVVRIFGDTAIATGHGVPP
jgi:hypothetical protein